MAKKITIDRRKIRLGALALAHVVGMMLMVALGKLRKNSNL
jgi:hypothetical protein